MRRHASYTRILTIFAAVIIGTLGYAHVSYADWTTNVVTQGLLAAAGGLVGEFMLWIVALVNTLAATALQIIAFLVDFGLRLNETVISKGIAPVGWKIARDVANLGFTIGLIAISFATILRVEQYGIKKLLPKLVFVALLINFSLLIPGVILDATNVFSHFFLSKIIGGAVVDGKTVNVGGLASLSVQLASSMEVSGFANIKAGVNNADSVKNIASVIKIVVGGIFIIFFQVLAAIAMGGVAYMIFYRYLVLIFLFIVAPLAWISLFLPAFGSLWKKWWDEFFKWAFFLPAMTFFLYLTVLAAANNTFGDATNIAMTPYNGINDIMDIIPVAAQMAVLIGLIFGSLMVAQKLGIAGAAATISAATGARKVMLGAITGAAVGPAKYFGARPVKAGAMALANVLNKPVLRWIPGAKGAVAGLSGFAQRKEEVAAYQKGNLSTLSDKEFDEVLKGRLPEGPVARAALLAEAAKRGRIPKLFEHLKGKPEEVEKRLKAYADAAALTNPGTERKDIGDIKALLAIRTDLAEKITDGKITSFEAMRKFVTGDKADEIHAEAWKDAGVVAGASKKHWETLYSSPKTTREALAAAEATSKGLVSPELVDIRTQISIAEMEVDFAKRRGVPQKDRKDADGNVIEEGLETMRRKRLRPLLDRERELLGNPATITDTDKAMYEGVARQLNTAEDLRRRLGREPSKEEIALAARGKMYEQYKNNRQQMGNPFGAFWKKPGEGGALPPGGPGGGPGGAPIGGGPTTGGAPTAPRTLPEMMGELKARRGKETQEAEAKTKAEAEAKRAAAGTAGFLGEMEEAEARAEAAREERVAAERKEGAGGGEELPPPSLPGTRPPTPPPSRPSTPAPARTPTPAPSREATTVPPRAPTPTPERTPATPSQREATTAPPREASVVPPRAPTRATAEQGVEAEARRRAEREEVTRAATAAREAEEARAEAARKTAEEARLKTAEKAAEAAAKGARAAEEELKAREAALGVTKEAGKETEKILREVKEGAKAAETMAKAVGGTKEGLATLDRLMAQGGKLVETFRTMEDLKKLIQGGTSRWQGKAILPPDNTMRIIKEIRRNNVDPDEAKAEVYMTTIHMNEKGEEVSRKEDVLSLRQMNNNFLTKGVGGVKEIRIVEPKT